MTEGRREVSIIGVWLIAANAIGVGALLIHLPSIVAHPAGWRAWLGPLVIGGIGITAGYRLLRSRSGWALALVNLLPQTVAVSAGPLAYRLVVGPFLAIRLDAAPQLSGGIDAHLLLIVGSVNQIPTGIAVNLIPCLALIVFELEWMHRPR